MRGRQQDDHAAGSGPSAEASERPEQNVGYDEAVKGAPLTPEERQRAESDSPLSDKEPPADDDPLLGE
jgi:hypothetical protein